MLEQLKGQRPMVLEPGSVSLDQQASAGEGVWAHRSWAEMKVIVPYDLLLYSGRQRRLAGDQSRRHCDEAIPDAHLSGGWSSLYSAGKNS